MLIVIIKTYVDTVQKTTPVFLVKDNDDAAVWYV